MPWMGKEYLNFPTDGESLNIEMGSNAHVLESLKEVLLSLCLEVVTYTLELDVFCSE